MEEKVFVFARLKEKANPPSTHPSIIWTDGYSVIAKTTMVEYEDAKFSIIYNKDYSFLTEIQLIKPRAFVPAY